MKKIGILIFLLLANQFATGQSNIPQSKSVFFELAGSGGIASINLEKSFSQTKTAVFTWRAGLSLAPIDNNNGTGIVFPLMVNAIVGKQAHKLEIGAGQGITITTKGSFFALGTAAIGYRYQPPTKKWFYRVTYTPLISYIVDFQIQQWAGFSIGYTLNENSNE